MPVIYCIQTQTDANNDPPRFLTRRRILGRDVLAALRTALCLFINLLATMRARHGFSVTVVIPIIVEIGHGLSLS